jgi:histidine ammonia-lyase
MTQRVIDNTFEVLAIQVMTMLQAVDYLNCQDKLSSFSHRIYSEVRAIFPKFIEDSPKYKDAKRIKEYLLTHEPEIVFI